MHSLRREIRHVSTVLNMSVAKNRTSRCTSGIRSGLMTETRFRQVFLLLLVTAISVAFVAMIRTFLLTSLRAAIVAGLGYPGDQWLLCRFRGRRALTAIATLLLLLTLVM